MKRKSKTDWNHIDSLKDGDIDYSDIPEIEEEFFSDAVLLKLPKKYSAKQISKQMFDFNKMAFERSFSAMVVMQDQAEKMFNMWLEQNKWLPEEGRKAMEEWVKSYKKSREDFKAKVEDGYGKLTEYLAKDEK